MQRTAFITGAASGIGRATAMRFAAAGWFVGGADLDGDGLRALEAEIGGERCATWLLDVVDKAAYDGVMAAFADRTAGRLDLLFNNAGICKAGLFDHVPYEETIAQVHVNVVGVINGVYCAMPLLASTENSLCMSTASVAATYGSPFMAAYAATKFAVKGLTEALAVELARVGSRAADVLPGLIDTPIQDTIPLYVDGTRVNIGTKAAPPPPATGPGRLIPAEDVAEAVWAAYHGDRVHYYVPPELEDIDRTKHEDVERVRDTRIEQYGLAPAVEPVT
jgi:NAD(P)-dependent dehydrogenase (short-subunit alcohol dehydrogenase family)